LDVPQKSLESPKTYFAARGFFFVFFLLLFFLIVLLSDLASSGVMISAVAAVGTAG
jgi:hypothetical protein